MANIFQEEIVADKPKSLSQQQINVYVPRATLDTPGIASYDSNYFVVNDGRVTIKQTDPTVRPSLIKIREAGEDGLIYDDGYLKISDTGIIATKQDKVDENIVTNTIVTTHSVVTTLNQLSAQMLINIQDISNKQDKIDENIRINTIVTTHNVVTTLNELSTQVIANAESINTNATNMIYGRMKGSYGQDGYSQPISTNISNGQIINLYYYLNNEYVSIPTQLGTLATSISNIISGEQVVGEAVKATKDSEGNVINLTYATVDSVYTKHESDERYLSRTYTNIYYYSSLGFSENVPSTPASGIQFSASVPSTGEGQLASIPRTLEGDYTFNNNSTDQSTIWLSTDKNCILQFRMLTYIHTNDTDVLMANQITEELEFEAGIPRSIPMNSIYSLLGSTVIDTEVGDVFRKEILVKLVQGNNVTCNLLSSAQYPSSFNLTTTNINVTIDIHNLNSMKEVAIAQSDWTDNLDGTYSVTISQLKHEQAPSNKYVLNLQREVTSGVFEYIEFTPQVDSEGNITITSYTPIDCLLQVASGLVDTSRNVLSVTNPTAIPSINYDAVGALRIIQTQTATALSLPVPTDAGRFYSFMVVNSSSSTQSITVNGQTIAVGNGLQFKWVGEWAISANMPTVTTVDVYDAANQQTLAQTLNDMASDINDRVSEVSTVDVLYGTDNNGDQTTHSISDIRSITEYTTTIPTSANPDGLKVAVLSSDPATKYSGWIYLIEESQASNQTQPAQGGNGGGSGSGGVL